MKSLRLGDVFARWARSLDPTAAEVERIRERVMDQVTAKQSFALYPPKEAMLVRYRQAYADLVAIKDKASDDHIFASVYRRQARVAALHSGATDDEIRAIEQEIRS